VEILNIDGTALPAPSAYKVQLSDLDSSGTGRTEDGVLVRERVRGGVAKISAGWAALSTADCAKVLNATAPDSMTVQYFFGGVRTAKMYAGDRTADLKAARDGQAVWEVAVNLIEFKCRFWGGVGAGHARPAALPQQAVYGMVAGGACPAPTWMWKRGE